MFFIRTTWPLFSPQNRKKCCFPTKIWRFFAETVRRFPSPKICWEPGIDDGGRLIRSIQSSRLSDRVAQHWAARQVILFGTRRFFSFFFENSGFFSEKNNRDFFVFLQRFLKSYSKILCRPKGGEKFRFFRGFLDSGAFSFFPEVPKSEKCVCLGPGIEGDRKLSRSIQIIKFGTRDGRRQNEPLDSVHHVWDQR